MTQFHMTFDSYRQSVALVTTDERIVTDIAELRLVKAADGKFECILVRDGTGKPVRLVASGSPEGRALAKAGMQESIPGFLEANSPPESARAAAPECDLASQITAYFAAARPQP